MIVISRNKAAPGGCRGTLASGAEVNFHFYGRILSSTFDISRQQPIIRMISVWNTVVNLPKGIDLSTLLPLRCRFSLLGVSIVNDLSNLWVGIITSHGISMFGALRHMLFS